MPNNQFSIEELRNSLSDTEVKILDILRRENGTNTAFIYKNLRKKRNIARSSVPVLLERLYKKGLVDRENQTCRGGSRYIYTLKNTREEYYSTVVESIVNKVIGRFGDVAVSYFHKRFSKK